jgi:hypothetical protein
LQRGKIALNNIVKACQLAVGIVNRLQREGSLAKHAAAPPTNGSA